MVTLPQVISNSLWPKQGSVRKASIPCNFSSDIQEHFVIDDTRDWLWLFDWPPEVGNFETIGKILIYSAQRKRNTLQGSIVCRKEGIQMWLLKQWWSAVQHCWTSDSACATAASPAWAKVLALSSLLPFRKLSLRPPLPVLCLPMSILSCSVSD